MKNINLRARIKRNKLDILTGKNFRDENSEIIKDFNSKNKKALVGIQREDGIYTIIGDENIYYLTISGKEGEISIPDLLRILRKITFEQGKNVSYEYLKINDIDSIWMLNIETLNALWNTLLLIDNNRINISEKQSK
jgi:hypothetical protein